MGLSLTETVEKLERLAPLTFAEEWDNVGLLLEPRAEAHVTRILLCIDFDAEVLEEARALGAELVVAYHPVIFKGFRRLSQSVPEERALLGAVSHGIAIYSPHTALDAAPGGINDWLAEALGPGRVQPLIQSHRTDRGADFKLVVFVPRAAADALRAALAQAGAGQIGNYSDCSFNLDGTGTFFGGEGSSPAVGSSGNLERVEEIRLEMVCPKASLASIARALTAHHPYEEPAWDLYPLVAKPLLGAGVGRGIELTEAAALDGLIARIKAHLNLPHLRLAASHAHAAGAPIRRVAVAAGSGASIFERAPDFELYVTGELRHHDVRALVARGKSVILSEHSHSERGYLPRFAEHIAKATRGAVEVSIAKSDHEPLQIV